MSLGHQSLSIRETYWFKFPDSRPQVEPGTALLGTNGYFKRLEEPAQQLLPFLLGGSSSKEGGKGAFLGDLSTPQTAWAWAQASDCWE